MFIYNNCAIRRHFFILDESLLKKVSFKKSIKVSKNNLSYRKEDKLNFQ